MRDIRDIPSKMNEKEAKSEAKWGVVWSICWRTIVVLFVSCIGFTLLFDRILGVNNNYILTTAVIATTIISAMAMAYLFGMGWYLKNLSDNKKWATCPSCGKSYCIEHTREETISESIVTEKGGTRDNVKFTNYRVGVKRIYWRCKECGESGDGEVDYKEKID